jgi:hypothetical protein
MKRNQYQLPHEFPKQHPLPKEFLQQLQTLARAGHPPFFLVALADLPAVGAFEVCQSTGVGVGKSLNRRCLFPKGSGLLSESLPDNSYVLHGGNVWLKLKPKPTPRHLTTTIDKLPGSTAFAYRTFFQMLIRDGVARLVKCPPAVDRFGLTSGTIHTLTDQLLKLEIHELTDFNLVPVEEAFAEHDRLKAEGSRPNSWATTVSGNVVYPTTVDEDALLQQGNLAATLVYLQALIAKHGGDAKITFDAGYNNISVLVDPVKS